ncbi:hypothetical protein TWF106_008123 [Orbilia oligospora]|uniref:Uncharacterized protein n=2 Tax=Orbilia oligospora TaxID=2813651 RepID=A0A7C8UTB1_ORBOL|nr:hypothetical protein TWF788_008813 [Orbilia oligospora]KAF3214898.1 hypothetical protein TWF679_004676 [Orbilia oligospora]KAF3217074.1 hypothetical protein TWF106_008123 [Orbilia oligospora]
MSASTVMTCQMILICFFTFVCFYLYMVALDHIATASLRYPTDVPPTWCLFPDPRPLFSSVAQFSVWLFVRFCSLFPARPHAQSLPQSFFCVFGHTKIEMVAPFATIFVHLVWVTWLADAAKYVWDPLVPQVVTPAPALGPVPVPAPPPPMSLVDKYLDEELNPPEYSWESLTAPDSKHEDFLRSFEQDVVSSHELLERYLRGILERGRERRAAEKEKKAAVGEGIGHPIPPLPASPTPSTSPSPPPPQTTTCGGWIRVSGPEPTMRRPAKRAVEGGGDRERERKVPRLTPAEDFPPSTSVPTALPSRRNRCRRHLPAPKSVLLWEAVWEAAMKPLFDSEWWKGWPLFKGQEPMPVPPLSAYSQALNRLCEATEAVSKMRWDEYEEALAGLNEIERSLAEIKARIADLDSREWLWEDTSSEITPEDEATLPVVLID